MTSAYRSNDKQDKRIATPTEAFAAALWRGRLGARCASDVAACGKPFPPQGTGGRCRIEGPVARPPARVLRQNTARQRESPRPAGRRLAPPRLALAGDAHADRENGAATPDRSRQGVWRGRRGGRAYRPERAVAAVLQERVSDRTQRVAPAGGGVFPGGMARVSRRLAPNAHATRKQKSRTTSPNWDGFCG